VRPTGGGMLSGPFRDVTAQVREDVLRIPYTHLMTACVP